MIVRYEVIAYAATLLAATIFVGAVVAWSFAPGFSWDWC